MITSNLVCSDYKWPTEFGLCVSGSIPALPAEPLQSDYDINWGIMVGVNVSDIEGCNLAGTFKTVMFGLDGSPQTNLRAVVHLHRDSDQITYCAPVTSDVKIPFTSFNTECWDGSGIQLTQDDVSEIDKIGIHIVSALYEIQVPKFCLGAIFLQ